MEVVAQEEKVKQQKIAFNTLMPALEAVRTGTFRGFSVKTYDGVEGLKQMCWNELKTKGELLSFGGQTIEVVVNDHRWAEQHRKRTVAAKYHVRELINPELDPPTFTNNTEFMKNYDYRTISGDIITFSEQIIVYNDTVSVNHWRENLRVGKVGVEIISEDYAQMMRQFFEHLWSIAQEPKV